MSEPAKIIPLFDIGHARRSHGQCQRCPRVDYLPWATEHGIRYCGHCWEKDALSYVFGRTGDVVSSLREDGNG